MRKLSAKGIPKRLSDDEKRDPVLVSQAILNRFRRDPVRFMNSLITMDEAGIHIYMNQRPKNNRRNGAQWFPASKEVRDTEVIK
jgi:hypothetical protein